MSLTVAITGGIACGKSLFSSFLQQLGVEILDADDLVHQLQEPGGAAVGPIQKRFGNEVIATDGSVDRRTLGQRVFSDPEARKALNAILHPMVREKIQQWRQQTRGCVLRAAVIPLLFEVGWDNEWDWIICVSSDTHTQMERLMRFRGLSVEQAHQRLEAQMPIAEKAARAHLTVNNNAGEDALASEAKRIYRLLMEKTQL